METIKPGWKTSEFWVTVVTTLWSLLGHSLPPLAQGLIAGLATAGYAVARAMVKRRPSPLVILPALPAPPAR